MAVVAVMLTPGGNEIVIDRVITRDVRTSTGFMDYTYVGNLNGETMSFKRSEVDVVAKEVR